MKIRILETKIMSWLDVEKNKEEMKWLEFNVHYNNDCQLNWWII